MFTYLPGNTFSSISKTAINKIQHTLMLQNTLETPKLYCRGMKEAYGLKVTGNSAIYKNCYNLSFYSPI